MTFLSMAKLGRFSELRAGTVTPAYENNKAIASVKIPLELEPIISDPKNASSNLWWLTRVGSVTHQERSGGIFELRLYATDSGFSFICHYDPTNKTILVKDAHYDDLSFKFSLPSIDSLVDMLNMSTLDTFKYIKENVQLNKTLTEKVKQYILRMES